MKRKESLLCTQIKKNGQQCRALANRKTGLCAVHSGSVPRLNTEIDLSKDLISVRKFLARTAMSLKRGKIKANDANALANLCDKLIKIHQMVEMEAKLDAMKAMIEQYKAEGVEYADALDMRVLESEYKDRSNKEST